MDGLSTIDGKLVIALMANYSDELSHLRALTGGGVWVWMVAGVYDTQYKTFVSRKALIQSWTASWKTSGRSLHAYVSSFNSTRIRAPFSLSYGVLVQSLQIS